MDNFLEFDTEEEALWFSKEYKNIPGIKDKWKTVDMMFDPNIQWSDGSQSMLSTMDFGPQYTPQQPSSFASKKLAFDNITNTWVVDPNVGYSDVKEISGGQLLPYSYDQEFVPHYTKVSRQDGWDRRTSNMTHKDWQKAQKFYDSAQTSMYIPFAQEWLNFGKYVDSYDHDLKFLSPLEIANTSKWDKDEHHIKLAKGLTTYDDYKDYYYATAINKLSKYYGVTPNYFTKEDVDIFLKAREMNVGQSFGNALNVMSSALTFV